MIGWLADGFRTLWALAYWNVRKSAFRWRGARGSPPCQNPSDSGRAFETRCDACFDWRQRARFRQVCPLLQPAPDGSLKCSVNAPDVRPFWGRCALIYGGGAAALYLAGVLALFSGMRLIGYPVRFVSVAWPPAWHGVNQARSAYFLEQAQTAFGEERLNEALMALSLAYQYNPDNHAAGLMLARLWQTSRPDWSNRLYAQLLSQHPEQRPMIAESWLRALVPRADFEAIEELAATALRFDPDHTAGWLQALVFANRRTGRVEVLDRLIGATDRIPDGARHVAQLEATARPLPPASARLLLIDPPAAGLPHYVVHYQARRLIELGFPADALDLAARETARLSERDRLALELAAYSVLGYRRLIEAAFDRVMSAPLSPATIDLVGAHLIEHPDPELYERLVRVATPERLPPTTDGQTALLTLYVLAGLEHDASRLSAYADALRARAGADYRALSVADQHFRGVEPLPPPRLLPLLQPLALEVNYALLRRLAGATLPRPIR